MPVLFGLAGLVLIVSGVRDRLTNGNPSLTSLLKDDFSGNDPFWKWMLAIILIGSLGYVPNLRPISRAFLVLVIVVFLLSNKGLFAQLQSVFSKSTTTPQSSATNTASSNTPVLSETGLNDLQSLTSLA